MTLERMVHDLLLHQIIRNPLPWKVKRDWAYEVTAFNGAIIAKCQTHEEAEEIIQMAEKIKKKIGADDWPVSEVLEEFSKKVAESHLKDVK